MSSVLQVQHLYTAGIPLLEAYLLPMANNRTHKECLSQNKMAASNVVQIYTHVRFPRSKKMANLSCSRTNRKRFSFTTKHFQRKSLKVFDLHPLLRRLVSFVAQIIALKVRCWVTDTHTHTHTDTQTKYCNPRTYARWGLTMAVSALIILSMDCVGNI